MATVLIADDDTQLLEAIRVRLESQGIRVLSSQDGYQAVALARREKPDLILLDINMPAGTGFSVHERIQQVEDIKDTPVFYITGQDSAEAYEQAERLGAIGIIPKPFESAALLDMVMSRLSAAS